MSALHARFAIAALALAGSIAVAQELEPRAYFPYPVGTNVAVLGYTASRGDVLLDPTLPIEDVRANFNIGVLAYVRGLGLFNRSSNLMISIPYTRGSAQGLVDGDLNRITRSGLGDMRFRFAVNLKGAPRLTAQEFRSYKIKSILATSILVIAPTGQYDPARLINLGTNRWAFKPELGYTRALTESGRWVADLYAGLWLFTKNKDFIAGERSQEPMLSTQFHLNYRLRPQIWAAFNSTFYAGGRSSVNGGPKQNLQQAVRLGGTFTFPIHRAHLLKVSFSRGAVVRFGGDFTMLGVSYQFLWM